MTIEVSSWTDLDNIRNDLSEEYVLTTDLDSSDSDYAGIGDDWDPIGENRNDTGWTLDGQGHEIRDLSISTSDTSVGLCYAVGEIRNLGVVDANVNNFETQLTQRTGILAGRFEGSLIENCYATGSVSADENNVGGLVGTVGGGATIRSCFSSAFVGSLDGSFVAGFVGTMPGGTIESCYALGNVGTGTFTAGFVGSNGGTIRESWAAVSNVSRGFTRVSNEEIGCYWDTDVGGFNTGGDATGLTTSEMQGLGVESTMSELRFVADWSRVVEGDNADADEYPILRNVPVSAQDSELSASITDYRTVVDSLATTVTDPGGGLQINLSWDDRAAGEDGFRVYRAVGSSPTWPDEFELFETTAADVEAFENDNNLLDEIYTYRVVAVEDGVESHPTAMVSETIGPPVDSLSGEGIFTDEMDALGIELTWDDRVAGEHSFRIYRVDADSGTWPDEFDLAGTAPTDVETFTDTEEIEYSDEITYRVTAVIDTDESNPTDAETVSVPTPGPFEITIVGTNSPVGVGETLEIDVEITNSAPIGGETTVEAELTEQ